MDWRTRIDRALNRGEFTKGEKELSLSWTTCAVGERHRQEPEIIVYEKFWGLRAEPVDQALIDLGTRFHSDVVNHGPEEALTTYKAIQRRVTQLRRNAARRVH